MGDTISRCFQAPSEHGSSSSKKTKLVPVSTTTTSSSNNPTCKNNKYQTAGGEEERISSADHIDSSRQLFNNTGNNSSPTSSSSPHHNKKIIDENDFFGPSSKPQQEKVSIFGDDQIISMVPVPVMSPSSSSDEDKKGNNSSNYFHCVVGSEEGDLALYCPKSRKVLSSCRPHTNEIMHLRYNTKSRMVFASSRDKSISLHTIGLDTNNNNNNNANNNNDDDDHDQHQHQQPTLQFNHQLKGHTLSVTAIDINQDDPSFLVSGSRDNTVRLWDCNVGRCIDIADIKLNIVHCVKWIPSLQLVAQGGEDLAIRLWDIRGNRRDKLELVDTMMGFDYHPICCDVVNHNSNPYTLIVGHNGFNNTGSTISFWDLRMKKLLRHCEGHSNTVRRICCSQVSSHIVSGSDDQSMRLWRGDALFSTAGGAGTATATENSSSNNPTPAFNPSNQLFQSTGPDGAVITGGVFAGGGVSGPGGDVLSTRSNATNTLPGGGGGGLGGVASTNNVVGVNNSNNVDDDYGDDDDGGVDIDDDPNGVSGGAIIDQLEFTTNNNNGVGRNNSNTMIMRDAFPGGPPGSGNGATRTFNNSSRQNSLVFTPSPLGQQQQGGGGGSTIPTGALAVEQVHSRIASLNSFMHPTDKNKEVIVAAFRNGEISTWSIANEKLTRLRYLA